MENFAEYFRSCLCLAFSTFSKVGGGEVRESNMMYKFSRKYMWKAMAQLFHIYFRLMSKEEKKKCWKKKLDGEADMVNVKCEFSICSYESWYGYVLRPK
jgi:hypothetical protein